MKILITISTLVLIVFGNISCHSIDAWIVELPERIRNLIRYGDVDNGIPVLDPYEFKKKQLHLTSETLTSSLFSANINTTNGKFTGLGDFKLQEFNFTKSEIAMEVNINIPLLKFYSEYYELDGNIYEAIPVRGQGIADIEIHNISLKGKIYLKQSSDGKSILLDKIVDPQFSIERIVSRTQFDNNIDDVINAMVEDLLADYLTRFNKFIAYQYVDSIVEHLNPTLNKFDTWNVITILLND
ncbi:uncharacterized protein LOC111358107 isoform X1 [Spodoptera litura]|uniref:Uncharacterized protein LOC111358107 isoform X1 n=1 Tax=Spodoptera litura TaxID=69820 RepID=A0A9J7EHI1_SPOLT|nr:uncharacterized protein LOC111358107 isoform X1 [Spodoptera litura]